MQYIAPVNFPASQDTPQPAYPDGNPSAGIQGAIPSGKAIENPMREILNVITGAGLEPSGNDLTQLYQAIAAMIANADGPGGGGSVSLAYNPVYPEVITNGGVMSMTASEGSVSVGDGQQFVHRGGTLYNTGDTDVGERTFSTLASKTYHLRWQYNGGTPQYVLKDLADTGYNPTTAGEGNAAFDSTFDDMLIARIVTDGNNAATVTALINKARLVDDAMIEGTNGRNVGQNQARFDFARTLNWARSPLVTFSPAKHNWGTSDLDYNIRPLTNDVSDLQSQNPLLDADRYRLSQTVQFDGMSVLFMHFTARA